MDTDAQIDNNITKQNERKRQSKHKPNPNPNNQKKNEERKQQNNAVVPPTALTKSEQTKKYLKSIQFIDALIEILIVILGTFLALHTTSVFERNQQQNNMMHKLEFVCDDMAAQSQNLQSILELYQAGTITEATLSSNADIDTTLLSEVLYSDEMFYEVHKLVYGSMISNCRTLNTLNAYLENEDITTNELLIFYNGLIITSNWIADEGRHYIDYRNNVISRTELETWYTEHINKIADDEYVVSSYQTPS